MKTSHLCLNFLLFSVKEKERLLSVKNSINFFWAISSERRVGASWMSRYEIAEY